MKKLAVGIALASLTLVSACGSDEEPVDEVSEAVEDVTEDVEEPSEEPSEDTGGEATTLTAVVGSEEDPDAFVIMLMDDAGEMVTELPAGDYTIEVSDLSEIHNFHLTGADVDETTTVDEVADTTWDVTLEPGDYEYVCDPHPNMSGAFTVA